MQGPIRAAVEALNSNYVLTYAQNVGSNFLLLSFCQDTIPRTFSIHRLFICKSCKAHIWQVLGEYQCIFNEFPVLFPVEDRLHLSSS